MALRKISDGKSLLFTCQLLKPRIRLSSKNQVRYPRSQVHSTRSFSTTCPKALREIQETVGDNTITIEGRYVDSVRTKHMLPKPENIIPGTCTLCEINVCYTDVLILRQFMHPDGTMLPNHVTGLCKKKENQVARMIHQAKSAGLLPNMCPDVEAGMEEPVLKQHKWKSYNVFFKPYTRYQIM